MQANSYFDKKASDIRAGKKSSKQWSQKWKKNRRKVRWAFTHKKTIQKMNWLPASLANIRESPRVYRYFSLTNDAMTLDTSRLTFEHFTSFCILHKMQSCWTAIPRVHQMWQDRLQLLHVNEHQCYSQATTIPAATVIASRNSPASHWHCFVANIFFCSFTSLCDINALNVSARVWHICDRIENHSACKHNKRYRWNY